MNKDTVEHLSLGDRILGCLLGGLIGDAMGGPTEGLHYQEIAKRFGVVTDLVEYRERAAGSGTDDSALKHMLCEAIIRKRDHIVPEDWAQVWRERMDPRQFMYPVANSFFKITVGGVPAREAGRGNMISNSSAMCISPIGIINACDPRSAVADAYIASQLIHSGFMQNGACAAAAATAAAFDPHATVDSIVSAATDYLDADSAMTPYVRKTVALARSSESFEAFREAYYADYLLPWPQRATEGASTAVDPRETVSVALALFLLEQGDAVKTILDCANFGRDSDTIGAIAGPIVGAFRGAGVFPPRWVDTVSRANPVDQIALAQSLHEVTIEIAERTKHRLQTLDSLSGQ